VNQRVYYAFALVASALLISFASFLLFAWFTASMDSHFAVIIYVDSIGEFWPEVGMMLVGIAVGIGLALMSMVRLFPRETAP
jgi:hypothetical protein